MHSQILDVAGQRRFAPWPPANFNREFACKQSIHVEIWQVLNRYIFQCLCASEMDSAFRNCTYRTLCLASSAIDAGICIDLIVCIALSNCLYRTLSSARTAADASISNNTCHSFILLKYMHEIMLHTTF